MFHTVLVANRGEVAVRVIRTLRALGARAATVYSDADAGARHVRAADVAVRIGPAAAAESYLRIDRILDAAAACGAEAVHPGYGFLAENAAFARACADAGLVFVGPPPAVIEAMGDKIRAKQTVAAAGVPVVPGRSEPALSDDELAAAAVAAGFPVLLKPAAGGGGKGMRLVHAPGELADAIAGARREAHGAFGDDTLLVERYVERPRHVEIQVLADAHGTVVHLGERECSLQRRYQKIVEEAPSPLLDDARRAAMGATAVDAARAVGYVGVGTVECIVPADSPDEFFFLEMNTRLQVEHPVTELVIGLDLVEQQLRVAAGEPLPFDQDAVRLRGHAMEARIYAEDPVRGFVPTGGSVVALREPDAPHVRVDSGLQEGDRVGGAYDPMLAKVVAWGHDRDEARRRLDRALAATTVLGVTTNVAFLRQLLADPDVAAGNLDTGLVDRHDAAGVPPPDDVFVAAALLEALEREPTTAVVDPWDIPDGWRLGGSAWTTRRFTCDGTGPVEVRVRGSASSATVRVDGGEPLPARASRTDRTLHVTWRDRAMRYTFARDDVLWLGRDGHAWAVAEHTTSASRASRADGDGVVRSPMPGTVVAVKVAVGDDVVKDQPLLVVEAMKMEQAVTAPCGGVVAELPVQQGQQVGTDQALAAIHAHRPTAEE